MSSPSPYEIASAIAAIVSAVGGAFAAVAAFRSAGAAREAALSAEHANRRAMLREVSAVAASILGAVLGVKSRAAELITEYKSAEVFSGTRENSSLQKLQETTRELQGKAESFVADAGLFANGATQLAASPVEEIDRVLVRLTGNLQLILVDDNYLDRSTTIILTGRRQLSWPVGPPAREDPEARVTVTSDDKRWGKRSARQQDNGPSSAQVQEDEEGRDARDCGSKDRDQRALGATDRAEAGFAITAWAAVMANSARSARWIVGNGAGAIARNRTRSARNDTVRGIATPAPGEV